MKRIILFPLPIAIVVYIMATWWLNKYYLDIEPQVRVYLAIGAALFSGIISYFLFKGDSENIDSPSNRRKK